LYLFAIFIDTFVHLDQLFLQVGEQLPGYHRQIVFGIFQNLRQLPTQGGQPYRIYGLLYFASFFTSI
jgi:hypothetical protein